MSISQSIYISPLGQEIAVDNAPEFMGALDGRTKDGKRKKRAEAFLGDVSKTAFMAGIKIKRITIE